MTPARQNPVAQARVNPVAEARVPCRPGPGTPFSILLPFFSSLILFPFLSSLESREPSGRVAVQ